MIWRCIAAYMLLSTFITTFVGFESYNSGTIIHDDMHRSIVIFGWDAVRHDCPIVLSVMIVLGAMTGIGILIFRGVDK